MIKQELERLLAEAVRKAQDAGDLPAAAVPDVPLERPQRPEHGDYASSLALPLAPPGGNGRGPALGDTLANVLAASGYAVQREYLVNDAGTQTETFAATLYARYQRLFGRQVDVPPGGYPGQ